MMLNKLSPSTIIPKAADMEKAAENAMRNISKQLKAMPEVKAPRTFATQLEPLKKPASAADNFPGIYNNLEVEFFSPRTVEAQSKLSVDAAIKQYGFFG